jgi:hypothetical protein
MDAKHRGKLAARWNAVSGAQIARVNERAQLIPQLDI